MPGQLLSLDGMDGAGKSTQLSMLADWLRTLDYEVIVTRDPGGTPAGEEIRRLLLTPESDISLRTEMLLYFASRSQLIDAVITPAVERGAIVICDRFLLSTIVYQGHAGGVDPEWIRRAGMEATGGIWPDWTGILDLTPEQSASRRKGPPDRIELRSADYHARVRDGYLAEAKRDPERIKVFDASQSPEAVHQQIRREVERGLQA